MENQVLISVVLPVYNAQDYLFDSINSILTQTHTNLELILVNDGSTDDSLKIMEEFSAKDSRINIINRENKGLIYSLNEGIEMARGQFIARMDADDISLPTRLKKQLDYITQNQLDICGCHYFEINEVGDISGLVLVPKNAQMVNIALASTVPFAHPSVLIRKNFMTQNNIKYGTNCFKHAEDLALWMNMHEAGARFGNVNDILFQYRLLSDSLSRKKRVEILNDSSRLFSLYYKKNKELINKELTSFPKQLNKYEQEWISSICMRKLLRLQIKNTLPILKKTPKKIIINSFMSELNRIFKL